MPAGDVVDVGAEGRGLRRQRGRDVALLGADEVGQQCLGIAQGLLDASLVAHALAQALDDVALGRGGMGRGVGQQRGE